MICCTSVIFIDMDIAGCSDIWFQALAALQAGWKRYFKCVQVCVVDGERSV
jgi:hypothetical protein